MKKQINIRASTYLAETIERLKARLGLNQTEVILLAVEKLAESLKAAKP